MLLVLYLYLTDGICYHIISILSITVPETYGIQIWSIYLYRPRHLLNFVYLCLIPKDTSDILKEQDIDDPVLRQVIS